MNYKLKDTFWAMLDNQAKEFVLMAIETHTFVFPFGRDRINLFGIPKSEYKKWVSRGESANELDICHKFKLDSVKVFKTKEELLESL